jgi:hypothetical protein
MIRNFREQALSAYERGRFLAALRIVAVIALAAVVVVWESNLVLRTSVTAAALACVSVGIRWRMHRGFPVVSTALWAGTVPLVAALSICRFAPACPPNLMLAVCGGLGLASGSVLGAKLVTEHLADRRRLGAGLVVAGLMSTLGCSVLGFGAVVGAALGLVIGVAGVTSWKNRVNA